MSSLECAQNQALHETILLRSMRGFELASDREPASTIHGYVDWVLSSVIREESRGTPISATNCKLALFTTYRDSPIKRWTRPGGIDVDQVK